MISLARFYRNSPYSESVRSKFDLVFTKLFSKDVGRDKRAVVFKNEELVKHVQELYADWASIPLYSTEEDDSNLLLNALKFQEFIDEANAAETFDELVRKDFFKRLKVFKEKTNENFFAPIVIAAAVESNVLVGNRYVELIEKARHSEAGKSMGEKYGVVHDSQISEATSKTLELLDILHEKKPDRREPVRKPKEEETEKKREKKPAVKVDEDFPLSKPFLSVKGGANKWLIIAPILVVLVAGWLFIQDTGTTTERPTLANAQAKDFPIEGTVLNDHVRSAKISKGTLYAITRESWDSLPQDQKQELVQNALLLGEQSEFGKVHFLNKNGESQAFASKTKVRVY